MIPNISTLQPGSHWLGAGVRSGQAGTHLDVREDGAVVVHLRVGHLGIGQDLPHCHCIRPLCVQHQHTQLIQTTMQQHHNTAYNYIQCMYTMHMYCTIFYILTVQYTCTLGYVTCNDAFNLANS